jgi:lantibiotic biosynthesis protein
LTADDLLCGLGVSEQDRAKAVGESVVLRNASGPAYRNRKRELRLLLRNPEHFGGLPGGARITQIPAARRPIVESVAAKLRGLASTGALTRDLRAVYGAFVHMHCNRLLGTDRKVERVAFGLVGRTRKGLLAA